MDGGYFERRMAGVIERLTKTGYTDTFRGETAGIRAISAGHVHRPEELVVDEIERFEGISDPADEAIVLALHSAVDECRGTYTAPYGKNMPPIDAELIARIPDARPK
jgi:hypothetical protein